MLLIWGVLWACADFINYLTEYILPYLEIAGLQLVSYLGMLLPRFNSYLNGLDTLMQDPEAGLQPFVSSLIQLPLLAAACWFDHKRRKNPTQEPAA